jgi:lipoprotein-anchoring transpeptidase ErfK/SrfK
VNVGGLSASAAAQRLRVRAHRLRARGLFVHVGGRTFELPAGSARVTADVDAAVAKALADSRDGWFLSRAARDVTGGKVKESIALKARYAPGVIPAFVAKVAAATDRKAADAEVLPHATGLKRVEARDGVAVRVGKLRQEVASALLHPTHSADITAPTKVVAAKLTKSDLAKKYPMYILIDRGGHQLRAYRHLKLWRTYPIAVGRAGLETPAGLYDVQWKEVNPKWRVPNSAWAGSLAGRTIEPGPDDPIKARWMAFNGGAGIHGTADNSSIGSDASHGCVRMTIPDVIELYSRTPVHTPVYVA